MGPVWDPLATPKVVCHPKGLPVQGRNKNHNHNNNININNNNNNNNNNTHNHNHLSIRRLKNAASL